jgi:hypothetical protein
VCVCVCVRACACACAGVCMCVHHMHAWVLVDAWGRLGMCKSMTRMTGFLPRPSYITHQTSSRVSIIVSLEARRSGVFFQHNRNNIYAHDNILTFMGPQGYRSFLRACLGLACQKMHSDDGAMNVKCQVLL